MAREVSYVKRNKSEIPSDIAVNRLIDYNSNSRNEGFWSYHNKDSNSKYINDYYHSFWLENYNFIKLLVEKCIQKKNNSHIKIDIAIIGGGNFFELRALNILAKKYSSIEFNVFIIDKNYWQVNDYSKKYCEFINSLTLVKNDFFDELNSNITYDIICFSRCINLTEQLNWSSFYNSKIYFSNFSSLLRKNSNSIIGMIQVNWKYLTQKSIEFDKQLHSYLLDNNIKYDIFSGFNHVLGEYLTQMSNLLYITRIENLKNNFDFDDYDILPF